SEPVEALRIPYLTLCAQLQDALENVGVSARIARTEAEIMAEADLHGVPSHGVRMLPNLLASLRSGRANPKPVLRTLREFGAIRVIDGDNGPGRYVSVMAMQAAMDRAKQFGVGVCLATRTTHWGRAHAYASRAAQTGMIALCITNAIPSMAAWGATRRVIGNNPIAVGIPRENKSEPFVLDIAMSQAAVGKVNTWLREGREVPQGWGVDAQGKASTNANDILKGAVLPFGGPKGAGLALTMELLTAALAGGLLGNELEANYGALEIDTSKLFIALDVDAFGLAERFQERVSTFLHYLGDNASEREPFLFPGERGWRTCQENMLTGVPIHAEIVAQLAAAGVQLSA
ncbi:MAG TPA: Ldh family oxidoreductase, partial [Rhodocyclaceae bacterium]|nr:Ldh family oxidoreductase [Rhodocyclaceae bacterium]